MELKEFFIPFSGLKLGKHEFEYTIDNKFFESFGYQEFNAVAIDLKAALNKMNTMMELDIKASGSVNVDCDLTSEPYNQEISSDLQLVVKFGEEYNDEDDEILILPHGEHQFNIAQYVYEMLVLAVPQKRVHPGVLDGTLKSEALDMLEELEPKETKKEKEDIDPRWNVLKKLLTDK
ncbi:MULTISPECIES: YceD family protein [unclassified Croceitalea]|uniref:YceD family protein n=1 Tax=unclassified Croceitalea TaxID=2632280 RepID=UPI0030D7D039